ncbi:uncharacterized protein Fot_35956 [Forsythia ovata]|uniref:Uncharacterized protein n=1 Tax=Forsythia ovata TaxID=205694 RepID=A0ABD1SP54_9LAMI
MMIMRRQQRAKRKKRTSLMKLGSSTVIRREDTDILTTPTTKHDMKMAPPNTPLRPTSPSPDRVKEIILAKTSLAPFPSGRSVVPAIVGDSFRTVDKLSTEGQKFHPNEAVSRSSSSSSSRATVHAVGDVYRRSSLESLFCYDKPIPEEIIEKPIGLSLTEKNVGDNTRCPSCQAKGAVLCITCSGSGLYIDSILESQGIIVKVRCLGCGGTGNTMCSKCGGRGHVGLA